MTNSADPNQLASWFRIEAKTKVGSGNLKHTGIFLFFFTFRDGLRESNVVTKVFEVQYVTPPDLPPEDDDLEFREEMEKERTMVNLSSM